MPWEIKKRGGKYVVVNEHTGKVKGRHATRSQANAQLRALYANVHPKRGGK